MEITGKHYKEALKYSKKLLKRYKEKLNQINVFPVADADTGTNLFQTINGIWKKVENVSIQNFHEFSKLVSDAAFESAQGNSGNILAAFLYGISEYSAGKEKLNERELIEAFENGSRFAYSSIKDPKEGTILTAMREFVNSAKKRFQSNFNFDSIFRSSIERAYRSLKDRRKEIPELLRFGVLDAGGIGFILVLKGWYQSLLGKAKRITIKVKKIIDTKSLEKSYSGYCVSVLLRIKSSHRFEKLEKVLKKIGDSFIVMREKEKIKLHIHCKRLEVLKNLLLKHAEILDLKVSRI